jgi:hypothetical protein
MPILEAAACKAFGDDVFEMDLEVRLSEKLAIPTQPRVPRPKPEAIQYITGIDPSRALVGATGLGLASRAQ